MSTHFGERVGEDEKSTPYDGQLRQGRRSCIPRRSQSTALCRRGSTIRLGTQAKNAAARWSSVFYVSRLTMKHVSAKMPLRFDLQTLLVQLADMLGRLSQPSCPYPAAGEADCRRSQARIGQSGTTVAEFGWERGRRSCRQDLRVAVLAFLGLRLCRSGLPPGISDAERAPHHK